MKVLFLIQNYSILDGSSRALYDLIINNSEISSYKIVCRKILSKQNNLDIEEIRTKKDLDLIIKKYDIIHYFKTLGYDLFNWAIRNKHHPPIITTVCQRPSKIGMMLSPNEIKYSDRLVFIDKTSYNDILFKFIIPGKKEQIYFGRDLENISKTQKILDCKKNIKYEFVTYGRGSSLNKCPKDIIDIWDKIKLPNKRFIIAGIPENSWLHKLTEGRKDIIIYPPLAYDEWLELCSTFDIFLYQLPDDTHSSIDGTLGDAMMLKKPCIYYGPNATKERFCEENDGIVCSSKSELINWSIKLGHNKDLRNEIGEKARQSTIKNFSLTNTIIRYNRIYSQILTEPGQVNKIKIPLRYKFKFIHKSYRQILRYLISGSIIEHKFSVYK